MKNPPTTEIATKYEKTIDDRLREHGMYDTIIAMLEAKDIEIKRMRWTLEFILGVERINDAHVAARAVLGKDK